MMLRQIFCCEGVKSAGGGWRRDWMIGPSAEDTKSSMAPPLFVVPHLAPKPGNRATAGEEIWSLGPARAQIGQAPCPSPGTPPIAAGGHSAGPEKLHFRRLYQPTPNRPKL